MLPSLSISADGRPRAVLVGIQLADLSDAQVESSLDELARLCKTLGLDPVARITQRRQSTGAPTVLGAGKLRELARLTGGAGVVPSPLPAHRRAGGGDRESDGHAPQELALDAGDVEADDVERGNLEGDEAQPTRAEFVVFDHELTPTQLRNL